MKCGPGYPDMHPGNTHFIKINTFHLLYLFIFSLPSLSGKKKTHTKTNKPESLNDSVMKQNKMEMNTRLYNTESEKANMM